jgi:DNA polymerase I
MDNTKRDVVFVDAYNLIYRAFHGNQSSMTNEEGVPTNALFTVAKMLQNLPKQFNDIAYCVAVFDGGGNFRTELDENYKANRKPMPENLQLQMPYMKELFDILGWPVIQAENVEADDVIGTLAIRSAKAQYNTYVVSGDKDFRQIATENLHVLDTMQDICYDPATIKEKMLISPENVVSYLALLGDGVDNVIGVEKIGKGTAAKLLNTYGDMDGIRSNQDKVKGVAGENLRAAFANGQIDKNIELITLKTDLDIKITVKDVRIKPIDPTRWVDFCTKMNFKSFLAKDLRPN